MSMASAFRDTDDGTIEPKRILKLFQGGFLAILLIFAISGNVLADDDHDRALDLRHQGAILPLARVLDQATAQYPGKILKVELEEEGGNIVYEIELLGGDGAVREMIIDAKSGQLLSVEDD